MYSAVTWLTGAPELTRYRLTRPAILVTSEISVSSEPHLRACTTSVGTSSLVLADFKLPMMQAMMVESLALQ